MEYEEIIQLGGSLVDQFVATLRKETKKHFLVKCVIDTHPPLPGPDALPGQGLLFSVCFSIFPPEGDTTTVEIQLK